MAGRAPAGRLKPPRGDVPHRQPFHGASESAWLGERLRGRPARTAAAVLAPHACPTAISKANREVRRMPHLPRLPDCHPALPSIHISQKSMGETPRCAAELLPRQNPQNNRSGHSAPKLRSPAPALILTRNGARCSNIQVQERFGNNRMPIPGYPRHCRTPRPVCRRQRLLRLKPLLRGRASPPAQLHRRRNPGQRPAGDHHAFAQLYSCTKDASIPYACAWWAMWRKPKT